MLPSCARGAIKSRASQDKYIKFYHGKIYNKSVDFAKVGKSMHLGQRNTQKIVKTLPKICRTARLLYGFSMI
jgi:hypothetical protein